MRHSRVLTIFITVLFVAACGDESITKKPKVMPNIETNNGGPADNPEENNANNANNSNTNNVNAGPVCGDEMIEGDEECEGSTAETCADFGFDGGTTSCTDCRVDTSQCTRVTCGDGVVDAQEACDDGELNGTYGYCNTNCSGPGPSCGDGVLNGAEICDGEEFLGDTCGTQGFDAGELRCTSGCMLDTSRCTTCGDGFVEGEEVCDDGNANGTYGACDANCTAEGPSCGDGIVNGPEECDGANLAGATCSSEGAGLGEVSCSSSCTLDTSACSMAPQSGEVIVTEIMQNPNISYDNDGEWFEVHNLTGRTVDLDGCTIHSSTSTGAESFDVLTTSTIAPSGYFVFARSSQAPFLADYTYNAQINLNNTVDSIEIYCDDPITAASTLIDEVNWDDGATFPDPDGASMSLDPFYHSAGQNDVGSYWCEATSTFGVGDRGTPGAPNDSCL